ncbi:hypothetical protein [Flavobacterium psychrophilum]|uniref:Uncharacterized protein n=1 Tax=Flavobacterium psychrophilum TaxID=96345 RepID=A0A7U2NEC8_FLAPS|nr:hypothetical protein [Flavobacterium psychrophilum]QRE03547.1 hypothetical protein H0H26_11755 [Flavobacterium psychrophilum]
MNENRKVLTTKGACDILNCRPAWFHRNFRKKLTRLPSIDNKAYYDYLEVLELVSKKPKISEVYNVIK